MLSIGIVGLPNVGKSTLFNALTKKSAPAENYPFCTIDPSVGIVEVPDERLWKLSEFSQTQKTIPAAIEFVDIAGLIEGASKGEGLGNQFLSHIREVDAILEMVRIFPIEDAGTEITHVYGSIDPLRDIQVINMELVLADLDTVQKRREKLHKDVKRGDKESLLLDALLIKAEQALEEEKMVSSLDLSLEENKLLKSIHLLTAKKILYGLNKKSDTKNLDETDPAKFQEVIEWITSSGAGYVVIDAKTEDDLKDFEGEEKEMFREELGGEKDDVAVLIRCAYELLGLETYFTTGEKETRAWTIPKGSTGPQAGAVIHSDFEQKYIRAQVIEWKPLLEEGSFKNAKEKGLVRTEGKEYIVSDGDVVEFMVG
ncbi:MAG: GTP-binding protein YchF [Flavobacteriaceae bacterium]|jgi:GTP-binding protein YchF